jgi:hypothetical protein
MKKPKPGERPGRALSRLGASKGGKARAAALSPRRRRQIARQAARARWEKRDAADGT